MTSPFNSSTIAAFACRETNWCQASLQDYLLPFMFTIIVLSALLAVVALLGNGLVLFVYYQNEALRVPSNTVLVGLAVTDFLNGAVAQPLFLCEKILVLTNCTGLFCSIVRITKMTLLFLFGTTLCFLSIMSLDRYVAIFYSLRYYDLVTNSRVIKLLLATGFSWTSIFVASRLFDVNIALPSVIIFLSNIVLITVLNFKIFREIRRLESSAIVTNDAEEERKKRERKTAKNLGIILGALFCCFLPLIFTAFARLFIPSVKTHVLTDAVLLWVAVAFALSNSSLNCFIYYWKDAEVRAAIVKVVRSATQRFRLNEVSP